MFDFKKGSMFYTPKKLMMVLDQFVKNEAGADARVMMILPEGRNPLQKEFNIKEIKLVENLSLIHI